MDHTRRLVIGFVALSLSLITLSACSGNWVRWEERELSYTVKAGDSLHQIAFKHQLDHRDLAWWNGIGRNDRIYPGQILRLDPPLPGELRTPQVPQQVSSTPSRAPIKPRATKAPQREPRPARKPEAGPKRWRWPAQGSILAKFNPAKGRKGLDIGGKPGDPISAAADGKVVYAGNALKGYGQLVIIKHGEDYLTAYGHNDKLLVAEGDVVKAGKTIATMGLGPQSKPLLHFEIRRMGKPVNPEPLLP